MFLILYSTTSTPFFFLPSYSAGASFKTFTQTSIAPPRISSLWWTLQRTTTPTHKQRRRVYIKPFFSFFFWLYLSCSLYNAISPCLFNMLALLVYAHFSTFISSDWHSFIFEKIDRLFRTCNTIWGNSEEEIYRRIHMARGLHGGGRRFVERFQIYFIFLFCVLCRRNKRVVRGTFIF